MSVLSKHVIHGTLRSINDYVPYTCYEVAHTWEPSCTIAFFDTMRDSFKFSLKCYIMFYLATSAIKIRKIEDAKKALKRLPAEILQSSVFLSANGFIFLGSFCCARHAIGRIYRWHGLLTGLFAGYVSILLERKSRRGLLAMYLLNLASEILFNMAVSRKLITSIPNGEVLIFSIATAGLMSLYRTQNGLPKSLQNPVKYFIGKEEEFSKNTLRSKSKKVLTNKHEFCNHSSGCFTYIILGGAKQFSIGYVLELAITLFRIIKSRGKNFTTAKAALTQFSLAKFLGGFSLLFKMISCALRWGTNQNNHSLHGGIAGFVAGFSSYFYKSSTISLYLIFKLIEILSLKGVDSGKLPYIPNFADYVYATSLAVILSTACFEPHQIRPSYYKFINGVSGGKFDLMFRKMFDAFGTNASRKFGNFVPNMDPKHVKSEDVVNVLKQHGKWIV